MKVTATDMTEEEVVAAVESALVEKLGIHPQNIEVAYDKNSGVVTYTITSDDAESVLSAQAALQNSEFATNLELPEGLTIDEFSAPIEVIANLDIRVDASNAEDVESAVSAVEKILEEKNYEYISEGKINYFLEIKYLSRVCHFFSNCDPNQVAFDCAHHGCTISCAQLFRMGCNCDSDENNGKEP